MNSKALYERTLSLLQELIATPSFSREEDRTAEVIQKFLTSFHIETERVGNNVWARNKYFNPERTTLLINSHHDTVKPNPGYTRDPFKPLIEDGKLFGLGSNDAGGPLVAMMAAFIYYYEHADLRHNIVFAASAEEEISGTHGIEALWPSLPKIDFAIVGEPTLTEAAIAEKGLLVLDCICTGTAGHAAREEGDNAIYKVMKDIEWFRTFQFPKISTTLGKVKMSVTVIQAGQAHNQVPAECKFTVDIRVTDAYTLEEVFEIVKRNIQSAAAPRSMRLRPSGIGENHPLVKAAERIGKRLYGSPTTSDRALIPVPSIKIGPGDSARSHSADEFIFVKEIEEGIDTYISLIQHL